MKEMLYIPVFFEKGKPLGFHVWTYGKGKYLEYSIRIDPELDHFYFERVCRDYEIDRLDERLGAIVDELFEQGQLNQKHYSIPCTSMFNSGDGITWDGLVYLITYGLAPHWRSVAEFIQKFNARNHIYEASKAALKAMQERNEGENGLMPAWKKARMDEGHGQTTDDMPAWKKARMELGQNQDTGAFKPRQ